MWYYRPGAEFVPNILPSLYTWYYWWIYVYLNLWLCVFSPYFNNFIAKVLYNCKMLSNFKVYCNLLGALYKFLFRKVKIRRGCSFSGLFFGLQPCIGDPFYYLYPCPIGAILTFIELNTPKIKDKTSTSFFRLQK